MGANVAKAKEQFMLNCDESRREYDRSVAELRRAYGATRSIRVVASQVPGGLAIVAVPVGPSALVEWSRLEETADAMGAVPKGEDMFLPTSDGGLLLPAEDLPTVQAELTRAARAYARQRTSSAEPS